MTRESYRYINGLGAWSCEACGCLVMATGAHDAWHAAVDAAAPHLAALRGDA